MDEKLVEIRQWAQEKIASGAEPPWAWFQYMKLIETVDAILSANGYVTTASSPRSERPGGTHLQLVDSKCQQDSVQPHPAGLPVHLPM